MQSKMSPAKTAERPSTTPKQQQAPQPLTSTLRRSSKLATFSNTASAKAKTLFSPAAPASTSGSASASGVNNEFVSPPRASWSSIQRQKALQAEHDMLDEAGNCLASPARIGSSPAKGRGFSSIFPPSPDNPAVLGATTNQLRPAMVKKKKSIGQMMLSSALMGSVGKGKQRAEGEQSASSSSDATQQQQQQQQQQQRKRFDLSDWQFDLPSIGEQQQNQLQQQDSPRAYNEPARSSTPTNGNAFPTTSTPAGLSLDVRTKAHPTSTRTVLRPRKSGNALCAFAASSGTTGASAYPHIPMTAPHPQRFKHVVGPGASVGHAALVQPSRLPVPRASVPPVAAPAAAVINMNDPLPVNPSPFAARAPGASMPAPRRSAHLSGASGSGSGPKPLSIRTNAPNNPSSISTRLQLSASKSLLTGHTLGKENTSGSSHPNSDDLPIASSFDACASAIRHRHRTLSISESEGGHSSDDDAGAAGDETLPDSPDFLSAGRTKQQESRASYFSREQESDVGAHETDGMDMDIEPPSSRMMLPEHPPVSRQDSSESASSEEASPFLDTPGRTSTNAQRKRGASLPFNELSASSSRYTLGASLPPHPAQSALKPSRISYPPKMLNFNPDTMKAKEGLYASVPASATGSTASTSSKPVDQLFLASILNGAGPWSSSNSTSGLLEESPRRASLPSSISASRGLQPVSPNVLYTGGRKRTANGAMIGSPNQPAGSDVPTKRKSIGRIVIPAHGYAHTRSKSQSTDLSRSNSSASAGAYNASRRPSVDSSRGNDDMDEEIASSAPSLPTLTDSSSATSSIASSHRSAHQQQQQQQLQSASYQQQKQGTEEIDFGDAADAGTSFISNDSSFTSSDASSSMTDTTGGHFRRTSSSNAKLFDRGIAANTTIGSPNTTFGTPGGGPGAGPKRASPLFKNVRPLQAAFANSGLISKKAYARSRIDRDSGVGLGMTPPAPAWKRLVAGSEASGTPGRLLPGSARSAFRASFSSSFGSPAAANASFGSPVPSLEVGQHPGSGEAPAVMPDTPCKRPVLSSHLRISTGATHNSGLQQQALHPLAQVSRPVAQERSPSSCSSTSDDSSSVVNSIPGSAVKRPVRSGMGPDVSPSHRHVMHVSDSPSSGTGSPSAAHSLSVEAGLLRRPSPLRRMGPALFRRRSSGQLTTGPDGGLLTVAVDRSGSGASRSGIVDWEPMTPTRTGSGFQWMQIPQLAVSPLPSPALLDTRAEDMAMESLVSPTSPLCAVSPYLPLHPAIPRQFREQSERPISASAPRAPLPQVTGLKRPAFRLRHSSSYVHTARQSELMSPDRFATIFSISRTLGQGEFGEAYEVADRTTGHVSAVKKTKVPSGGPKERLRRLEEVDILRLLSRADPPSAYVIRLYDAWEQSGNLFIQTELCSYGNLATFLAEYGEAYEKPDEARVWKIMAELASGVAHIHAHGVLHLDLKPANVFITDRGGLKIGDFGLATRWPRASPITILQGAAIDSPGSEGPENIWPADRARAKSSDAVAPAPSSKDLEREGDREYIAPEILRGQYGKEADMFSLGLIVLEAAANVMLPDNGLPWRKLRENDFSDVELGHLSDELVHLLFQLLSSDPTGRTSVVELLAHPIVAKIVALRTEGLRIEDAANDMQDVDDAKPRARGAVVEEDPEFLRQIFAEVRLAWHSPRRGKQVPQRVEPESANEASMMDVDEA